MPLKKLRIPGSHAGVLHQSSGFDDEYTDNTQIRIANDAVLTYIHVSYRIRRTPFSISVKDPVADANCFHPSGTDAFLIERHVYIGRFPSVQHFQRPAEELYGIRGPALHRQRAFDVHEGIFHSSPGLHV